MPINKIVSSFDEAVADMFDGMTLLVGGFGTAASIPNCLLEAVARKGVKNITTVSNTGGFGPDIWKMQGHKFTTDLDILIRNHLVKKAIISSPVSALFENNFEKQWRSGELEMEMIPQGTLAERVRAGKAGLGGIYIPTGVGTEVEEGKEKKVINGREYLLELPIYGDFAIIHAHKADRWGNLVYRRASRTFNATMAGAAKVTIAEVDEIVELGELDPDHIVTPGVYVDRVVLRPKEPEVDAEITDDEAVKALKKFQSDITGATEKKKQLTQNSDKGGAR